MAMSRRAWIVVVMIVLAAGASGAWFYTQSRGSTPRFRAAKVERGPLTATVSATGTLNAVVTVQVGSQVSGQIKELFSDVNSQVKRNQLVARIDPEKFQAAEDTAQAAYDSAVAQAESAKAQEVAQASQIRSAEAQLKVTEAMLQAASANVVQQEAGLKQAQVDLDHTEIRAPVDGVVVSRTVDVGQTVAASLQAPTLFTIAQDLTQMQVDTNVDEADVGRIREGLHATFTVDSFANQTFSGEVMQVRKAPQVLQNVVTYNVVISARNPDHKLLPGMTANVRLIVDQKDSVLKVPNSALRFRLPGDDSVPVRGVAPGAGAGGGASQPSIDQIRERLTKSLGLTSEQQQKLDPILQDTREKIRALGARGANDNERRNESQRIREASREQIRGILTPEQRTRYDQDMADARAGRQAISGRVVILGPDAKPVPVTVRLGITDGSFTEVLSSDLKEGQEVLVGSADSRSPGRPGDSPRLRL